MELNETIQHLTLGVFIQSNQKHGMYSFNPSCISKGYNIL